MLLLTGHQLLSPPSNGHNGNNGNNHNNGRVNCNNSNNRNSHNGDCNNYGGKANGCNGNNGQYSYTYPRRRNQNNATKIVREYKFSQNGKPICQHCSFTGHMQKECRSRICDNKPCVKPDRTTYYPVNSADSIDSVFPQ